MAWLTGLRGCQTSKLTSCSTRIIATLQGWLEFFQPASDPTGRESDNFFGFPLAPSDQRPRPSPARVSVEYEVFRRAGCRVAGCKPSFSELVVPPSTIPKKIRRDLALARCLYSLSRLMTRKGILQQNCTITRPVLCFAKMC